MSGASAARSIADALDRKIRFQCWVQAPVHPDPVTALVLSSASSAGGAVAEVVDDVATFAHEAAQRVDRLYDWVEALLARDLEQVDVLLAGVEIQQLTAEEIVALLIVTLGARAQLVNRNAFITRARPILDLEPEGAAAVLAGLA